MNANVLQFLILWLSFRNANSTGFVWFWYRFAPFLILVLTLTKFLPLIRYATYVDRSTQTDNQNSLHNLTVQFWTLSGASSLDFLTFGLIYSWLTVTLHLEHNVGRRKLLFQFTMICFSVAVVQLIALVIGLRFPFLQALLFEVSNIV